MLLARVLFAASSRAGTGTLTASLGNTVPPSAGPPSVGPSREVLKLQIELDRGYVYSIHGGPRMSRPEDQLRELLRREAFSSDFIDNEPPLRLGRCPPFHPAAVVRNHVEAWLGPEAGSNFRARAGSQRLRLEFLPHASCLGRDERPLVTLLGLPRSLPELGAMRLVPMTRIERLCAFLEAVGSIVLGPSPYELLGLQDGAPHEEVRRAYKRLARELHPDLHPGANEDDRRELASRFAALHEAYRRLLPSG
jgi:hypothetical protein